MHNMGYHGEFDHYCVDLNIVTYKNILYIMLSEKNRTNLGGLGLFLLKSIMTHTYWKKV